MYTLRLTGKIITPIITRKNVFKLKACNVRIINPKRRYYTKLNIGKPMVPYAFECYLGKVELTFSTTKRKKALQKLQTLLAIKAIGRLTSEGLGVVQWLGGTVRRSVNKRAATFPRKLKIRKGLPHDLPEHVQQLVKYGLLHDFVHTAKHQSKIYAEVDLPETPYLRRHHDTIGDSFIQVFQRYDRLAASITRTVRSPRTNRYTWRATRTIDFEHLAIEIQEVATNLWKLYDYIYTSKALEVVNESLQYGHASLKNHLLVISNLIVQDYQQGNL